jgi:hypothetical protein
MLLIINMTAANGALGNLGYTGWTRGKRAIGIPKRVTT